MKKPILISAMLIVAIITSTWWLWSRLHTQPTPAITSPIATQPTATSSVSAQTTATSSTTGTKTYRNEEWGFQFEYPEGWEVTTPAFGSAVSLFNMEVGPDGSGLVLVNITPQDWIEEALVKMKDYAVS